MELCSKLRWKGFSREIEGVDELALVFARNHVQYSCLTTCQPWGPDDELAAPECCNGARPCFEPSPLLVTISGSGQGDPRVS